MTDTLSATDLRVGYAPGTPPVLDGLSLVIPPGRFTALVGPNGSGKSTLLRTLGGLVRPLDGQVRLGDRPVADLPPRALARRIAILPQNPQAPEGMGVADLVRTGRFPHRGLLSRWSAADEAAVTAALRMTGLERLADRPLDTLSGGQRQRAWIAMVLAQESAILLLDEPTSFLDLSHQIDVLALIGDLVAAGRTVVAVLHDLNQAARHADHLIALQSGRIAAEGAVDRVMTPALLRAVFEVEVSVFPDPATGKPFFIPRGRT